MLDGIAAVIWQISTWKEQIHVRLVFMKFKKWIVIMLIMLSVSSLITMNLWKLYIDFYLFVFDQSELKTKLHHYIYVITKSGNSIDVNEGMTGT